MSFEIILMISLAATIVVPVTVTLAKFGQRVSNVTAARVLIGIPLCLVGIADIAIAVMLIKNGHEVGAVLVQIPTLVVGLAFLGTVRPSNGWVAVQLLVCGFLLLMSFLFLMTAGVFTFMFDVLIFAGTMYTASAARRSATRNDAYWQYYFSRNA